MSEQLLAANRWQRVISGRPWGYTDKRLLLTVQAELVKRGGNDYPYYSITGSVELRDKRYRDPIISCGAIHDTILEYYPQLAPLVDIHLAEVDGKPMHAEANARYWSGLSKYTDGRPMSPRGYDLEIELDDKGLEWSPIMLARHLRVSEALARDIRAELVKGLPWEIILRHAKLSELWSNQAGQARSLLNPTPQAVSNALS
jgi:hypothetical protein